MSTVVSAAAARAEDDRSWVALVFRFEPVVADADGLPLGVSLGSEGDAALLAVDVGTGWLGVASGGGLTAG